ncbi:hypothetical protein G6F37_000653 [Rhizopus arrhizus]|nr:hypothetical protein G6F38_000108 [Rhizopus arrhizus]KAG1164052.1 hypothetical protein G6F37_000653 [Rhizopus arrhizus]
MKKLVILGGGAAGFLIAIRVMRSKISDIEVTLVDSKTFFEYTPALCSVLYEKSSEEFHRHFMNITFDYETVLKKLNVKFVPGKVKSLGENQVYVSVKKDELVSIDYDYLAICTGSSYADPWKPNDITHNLNLEARMTYLNEQRQAYLNAKSILIIGGGPVGVESAAEIVYRSPQKLVTLVNSGSCVLASAPQELGKYAQKILNSIDVKLISNEKIEKKYKDSDVYVTDESKQEIIADLVYNCIGVKPNSEFLKESYQEWLDDKGYIQVEKTLNVKGKSNVFALGDINNLGEAKLYYTAHMQAMHFVRNLSRVLNGQKMVPYQNAKPAMFISMGPYYGVGTVSGIRFTGWPFTQDKGSKLAAWIKYIIEKINVQGGGSIEIVINESLYMYSNLLPF